MRASKAEDLQALERQFADPMKTFETKEIDSASDVEDVLSSIETRLNPKQEDWSVRYEALKDAMGYLNGQIDRFGNADYSKLAPGIAACVTDLRSSLVKMGSLLIAACAVVWKSDYVGSVETVVPALFKQLSHGTTVIANSCRLALNAIATNVQHRRTCRLFLSNKKSKNSVHRLVVAEALSVIKTTWPVQVIDSIKGEVLDALSDLCDDASADVRKVARASLNMIPTPTKLVPRNKPSTPTTLEKSSRQFTPHRRSKTPTQPKKKLQIQNPEESAPKNNNSIPNNGHVEKKVSFKPFQETVEESNDISQYMPPRTKGQANAFVKILKEYSDKNAQEPLIGLEEFLPEAVISSVRFIPPESTVWKPLMSFLFRNYAREFTPEIRNVVVAFEVSSWMMDLVTRMFEPQVLLDAFGQCRDVNDEDAYLLFTGLFSRCLDMEIKSGLRKFLKKLVEVNQNEDDVCLIENALEVSRPKVSKDQLVSRLVNSIRQGKSWLGKSQKLVIALSKGYNPDLTATVQTQLTSEFKEILATGTADEKGYVREFLTDMAAQLKYITFVELVPFLIPCLLEDDLIEREKTEQCFMTLMTDEKVIQRLLQMLNEDNSEEFYQVVLNLLSLYVNTCSLNQLSDLIQPFMRTVDKFIASETIGIRRLVVMILVEFKCKAPKTFLPFYKSFNPSQQKLITLYSSRRC